MQKLEDIEVYTETTSPLHLNHGNAEPVLHEILYALQLLHEKGETTTIDLRSMPFGPGDEARLLNTLGRGEVSAKLDALGDSEIWETAFAGVWIVDHQNASGEHIALQVEVTHIPGILCSQRPDITESISRLEDQLMAEPAGNAGAVGAGGEK